MDQRITPPAPSATLARPPEQVPVLVSEDQELPEVWPPVECRISEPFIGDPHIALVEKALANFVKARRLALRVTDERDWTDVGGKPYLNATGALKVAAVFGVSLTDMRVEALREDLQGKEIVRYVARTTARFLGREVDAEGVASSDDPFFSRKDGRTLPPCEVNLNSVRKKAVTNAQSRAVRAILGLGGLTWEEVSAAGVKKGKVATASYAPRAERAGNGKAPMSSAGRASRVDATAAATAGGTGRVAPAAPAASGAGRPAPAVHGSARTRLKNMLTDIAAFEDVPFGGVLRRYTEFKGTDGKPRWAESVEAMSDAWAERSLEAVERDWRSVPWSDAVASSSAAVPF